jgi:BolA protein
MEINQKIEYNLKTELDLHHFEIKDFTGRHLNHKQNDGGFHLEAIIVSDNFINQTLIERHRIVYKALGDLMNHEIHAFSMKTLTIKEWNK